MTPNTVNFLLEQITPHQITNYSSYWNKITPNSPEQIYDRWLFAFLSVHTTWQSNVRAFKMLKANRWDNDRLHLEKLIIESGVGLKRIRTEGIWRFHNAFWDNPIDWIKHDDETWVQARDRLSAKCFGLSLTKTAFACELIYPMECQVVCLDAHILKLYGADRKIVRPSYKTYRSMEEHWSCKCNELNLPSPIARSIVWDRLLNQQTMDYWTHVFH